MADLLRRIAEGGDPKAFREFYEAFGPRVKPRMRIAYRKICQTLETAE